MRSHERRSRRGRGSGLFAARMERLEPRQLLSDVPVIAQLGPEAVVPRQMEYLNRGVVALHRGGGEAYLGWRLFGNDPADIVFDVYRSTSGGAPVKRNVAPITATTDFVDTGVNTSLTYSYFVRPIVGGIPQPADDSETFTLAANATNPYLNLPLQIPTGGTTPDGVNYTYNANDASVGDLDGDGQYEIILKWDPSNSKDNSQSGHTGNVYLDAYRLDGTLLWRIDLGKNIRAGAHYTQFMVYDLDGDGKAEVAAKTAPGTVDGTGNFVLLGNDDPNADYRNSSGYILEGPEYLTIFDGQTGAELATTNYIVPRGNVSAWGDSYGNRVDRFHGAIAYLDGQRPSLIMARGYYTRATIAAWDWRNGNLTMRWLFDSRDGTPGNLAYEGKGNHGIGIGDVDGDGRDEIIYGAAVIDDDGKGMYSGAATGSQHGDAMHFGDLVPSNPGLEVFKANGDNASPVGIQMRDALTGNTLWAVASTGSAGAQRATALDIDPNHPGYEAWGGGDPNLTGRIFNSSGQLIASGVAGLPVNFGVWWDGDLLREFLDNVTISKWNPNTLSVEVPANFPNTAGLSSNNGTKANPALSGDILGDWREEVIWRTSDNSALRIYTTTFPSTARIYTLMHDPIYRLSIAWQNDVYNQPPHPGFFLGHDMAPPPVPNIYLAQGTSLPAPDPPSSLIAHVAGLNQIGLSWSASPSEGVTYRVRRSTIAGGPYTILAGDIAATSYVDTTANNGVAYHYVVTAVDDQPAESIFSNLASATIPVPVGVQTVYPAENATIGGGTVISTEHAGFNGTGYADFPDAPDTSGYLEFTNIDGGGGGVTTIRWRFAMGAAGARNGSMIVNGVTQSVFFPSTFGWGNYFPIEYYIELNPGTNNTIRLQVAGEDLGNIDELLVIANPDTTPPKVTSFSHVYTTNPHKLYFGFDEAVDPSIGMSDLMITLLGPETQIIPTAFMYNPAIRMATWTLPAGLPDGNYRATFATGGVIDASGNAMPGTWTYDFFVLAGDANRDRIVNDLDLTILQAHWLQTGKSFTEGNFNYDGIVDQLDLDILTARLNQPLDPPTGSTPAPPPPPRRPSRTAVRVMELVG